MSDKIDPHRAPTKPDVRTDVRTDAYRVAVMRKVLEYYVRNCQRCGGHGYHVSAFFQKTECEMCKPARVALEEVD